MDPLDLEAAQKAYEARHLIQQDRGRLAVGHAIAGSVLERSDAQSGALSRVLEAEATAIFDLLVAETDHGSTTVAPPAGLLSCVPSTPHDAAAATAAAATGNSGLSHNPTTGSIERGQKVGARPAVRASELYAKYHSGDALKHLLSAEEELKSSNASNASTASGSSSGSTESAASAVSVASAVGTTSCATASSASASGAAAAPAAAAWVFDFSGPKTHLAALGSAAPAVSSTAHKIAPEVRPQTPRTVARLQAARSAAKVLESALSADLSADEAKRGETGASNASSDAAAGRTMALAILGGEILDDILGGHAVEAAVPTAAGSSDQHDGSVLGTARQRAITMRVAAVAKRAQAERAAAAAAAALSAAEAAEAAAAGAEFALMMLMGDDFGDDGALPLVAPPATG